MIFEFFFQSPHAYLYPLFIYYSKYFLFYSSQYNYSNIKILLYKYEKNVKNMWKNPYTGSKVHLQMHFTCTL